MLCPYAALACSCMPALIRGLTLFCSGAMGWRAAPPAAVAFRPLRLTALPPLGRLLLLQLILPQEQYGGVLRQLRRDLDLLQRLHVIDYSLLLGVHFARW